MIVPTRRGQALHRAKLAQYTATDLEIISEFQLPVWAHIRDTPLRGDRSLTNGGSWGAAVSTATFIATVTIIPFMTDGWDPVAGFPAMTGKVPFLMKDIVLLAVSLYLLRQDVVRVTQR